MKKYPSSGDKGQSRLINGAFVGKNAELFHAVGTVDELSSFIGWCAAAADGDVRDQIAQIQKDLFAVGAQVAGWADRPFDDQAVNCLQRQIHQFWEQLPPLKGFVVPYGCELACRLHIARTVCRRAERLIVQLARVRETQHQVLQYINRLSDWLFVAARYANFSAGLDEQQWHGKD